MWLRWLRVVLLALCIPYLTCSHRAGRKLIPVADPSAPSFPRSPAARPSLWQLRVVRILPSDDTAFTQGLAFSGGDLYQSTGLWGASSLRKVSFVGASADAQPSQDSLNGTALAYHIDKMVSLPREVFGEGIAVLGDRIYQLTYQNGVARAYDKNTLARVATYRYPSAIREGWGLAADAEHSRLFLSDGSSTIWILDPEFELVGRLSVVNEFEQPVTGLNELEFMPDRGELWANVYGSDCILRISSRTGRVLGWIIADDLYPDNEFPGVNVFNGIAYDTSSKRILVTGKSWPHMFEVAVAPSHETSLKRCEAHSMDLKSMMRTSQLISGAPTSTHVVSE